MSTKRCGTFRRTMPRKSAAGHGKKRGSEGRDESLPPAKVARTAAEGKWRASTIRERDMLRLIAERVLQEEGVVEWRTAGSDSSPWENMGDTVMKSETPKPATSSTAQVGTSEHSLPKEPVAESTAEPPIVEDVPAVNEGKDLEPPDAPRTSQAQEEHEVPESSRVSEHQEGEVPCPKAELLEDPLMKPERVSLMLELSRRFTEYTKSLIDRSREKSALLYQIGDVLPRTHETEDILEAQKAKNAKLQEELAALKASHRDAIIDEQRKRDLAIRKVKDLTAQKEKEKEQLKKALEDLQLKYSDLDEEYKTVVHQLKDADKKLKTDMQRIQSMARDKERQEKEMNQLATAAHQLCEFVNPTSDGRSLVERLVDAPTSIAGYVSSTAKLVLTHALAVVKSYFPGMDVCPFAEGISGECTEEQFNVYRNEVQDVAHKIVDDLPLF
ncbi:uncharacterized protein C2845_PM13G09690 [Panicum miliaceum]|uniref:Uncharacterized protein n=1 Tax=Panicum miliaceum TaxID=4540 RepID=A0A3L6RJV7_PANMI|nr:uncharacterized protein C2845_PM13G09690 [Panicum miliaceum]